MLLTLLRKGKHILFFSYLELKRKYRRVCGLPIIHVFGDSHSLLFQHELFTIHHMGPATAFKLSANKSTTNAKQKINNSLKEFPVDKKNYFLFVFGEIDCRIHINKASKIKKISITQAISQTVRAYGEFLIETKKIFPRSIIMVLNVLPSGEQENIYDVKHYPSRDLHLEIVKKFNKELKIFCEKHDLVFLEVFDELLDKKGERIKEYVFDSVHYNKKILPFIIRELKRRGIN